MTIIKAIPSDVTEITNLVNSAYRGETSRLGWTSEDELLDGPRIDEQTIKSFFDNEEVTILKQLDDTGKIVGTVYLEIKGSKLYLGMLCVSPELQNNRTGRAILEEAEKYAKQHQCSVIMITVLSARIELVNWYERRGFVKSGEKHPFPADANVGTPKQFLELIEMLKTIQ
ncbi:GNAT family N-acetyltransferase [Pedobacter sp. L105]|uniref:GNAT family N-acetyltransferase n=1 Tax=Pedobacter sp. L105 TaxID=1641871 RepID=UPI00131D9A35|nr:GNAT family N-acetyltransferase [Pedobacter sp. L105]